LIIWRNAPSKLDKRWGLAGFLGNSEEQRAGSFRY